MSRPTQLWLVIFGLWVIFLSGAFAFLGPPGAIQAIRLTNLLDARQKQLLQAEANIMRLEGEISQLEKSPAAQTREIRRVLGYAGPDELIFDFSPGGTLSLPVREERPVQAQKSSAAQQSPTETVAKRADKPAPKSKSKAVAAKQTSKAKKARERRR